MLVYLFCPPVYLYALFSIANASLVASYVLVVLATTVAMDPTVLRISSGAARLENAVKSLSEMQMGTPSLLFAGVRYGIVHSIPVQRSSSHANNLLSFNCITYILSKGMNENESIIRARQETKRNPSCCVTHDFPIKYRQID